MSLTMIMPTPLQQTRCSKRKRNQVISYNYDHIDTFIEGDEDLDMDMSEEDENMVDPENEEEDESYSQSHKKKNKANKNKKRKTIKEKPQPPFPFLKLPAEIRNKIYEYCLVEPTGLLLRQTFRGYRRSVIREDMHKFGYKFNSIDDSNNNDNDETNQTSQPTRRHLVPSLLATNQQIHTEASSILYNQPIHVKDTTTLHTFISSLRPTTRLSLCGTIIIHEWAQGRSMQKTMNHAGLTALSDCPNLRHVVLNRRVGYYHWNRPYNNKENEKEEQERMVNWFARQIYRDGFLWMQALGCAKGRYDAVVDVLRISESETRCRGRISLEKKEAEMKFLHAELRRLIKRCK